MTAEQQAGTTTDLQNAGREIRDHFDAVSGIYYEMVDAYRADLGYYHRRELEVSERWAKRLQPGKILDAGTGPGRHSIRMAELGFDVVSLDISRSMLRELIESGTHHTKIVSTTPVQGDVKNLPFQSTAFDFIVCAEVIEHLPSHPIDAERTALELARVLRPGGYMILEFPLRLHSILRHLPRSAMTWNQVKRAHWYHASPPPLRYQQRFSLAEIERIVKWHGFRIVDRVFLRIIPSGYANRFPWLDFVDRVLERIPGVRLFARETVLILQKAERKEVP